MDKANQFQSLNIALMVTLKRITQAEDEAFGKLRASYTEAFPVEERRVQDHSWRISCDIAESHSQ